MATPTESKKDTIYIDVDDEITGIIEKLQKSEQRIVALVLPKRATVLQSVVNMKLLKHTAAKLKKNVVLITSEAGLLPLAGAVGLHVASSLQSKPAIPPSPNAIPEDETVVDDTTGDDSFDEFDPDAEAAQPVGVLASKYSEPETIQLDNEDAPVTPEGAATAGLAGKAGKGKNKKLKIPNFNKFRVILIVAILAVILLIGGMVWANSTLPKATISLKTNSTDVDTKATVILDPKATEFEPASNVIPAKIASKQQTGSQQVSTSGQKNNGTKASGSVTMTAKVCGLIANAQPVPAGTGVSAGGKTFITQSATNFQNSGLTTSGCTTYQATGTTSVISQSAGADYNIGASDFTVAGRSDVTAKSSDAFAGGTDNIIKIVAQADIDSAKTKISGADTTGVKTDLEKLLKTDNYTPILSSLNAGEPTVTPSAAVGDQADTVTVTQVTAYTMYGVKSSDIKKVITSSVNKEIDTTKQQIITDGVGKAKYQITSPASSGPLQATLTATSLAGPDIDIDKLAKQFAGKKSGDVKTITQSIPGVSDVSVTYSPFWVKSVPKKTEKITIVIVKADGATTSTQSSDDN